jgi:hypothetical protein
VERPSKALVLEVKLILWEIFNDRSENGPEEGRENSAAGAVG